MYKTQTHNNKHEPSVLEYVMYKGEPTAIHVFLIAMLIITGSDSSVFIHATPTKQKWLSLPSQKYFTGFLMVSYCSVIIFLHSSLLMVLFFSSFALVLLSFFHFVYLLHPFVVLIA